MFWFTSSNVLKIFSYYFPRQLDEAEGTLKLIEWVWFCVCFVDSYTFLFSNYSLKRNHQLVSLDGDIFNILRMEIFRGGHLCLGKTFFSNRFRYFLYSECSIIQYPPSQLIRCRIANCRIIESSYITKYSSRPFNYPLNPVGLCW